MTMNSMLAIPIFVAVVENNSFSGAAKKLGITKSAVSKRITALEADLGVKLIQRSTRHLHLTEAGERYFSLAQEAFINANEAENAAMELQASPKGNLRINIPMSFGRLHIIPFIPEFLLRYPGINIQLEMNDGWVDIIAEGVDIALRGGDLPDSSLIARKIAPFHSVLCASSEYLKKYGVPESPDDLHKHNCILFSNQAVVNEWRFMKNGKERVVKVSGNYQVNNSEALKDSLIQGLGIGRLPTFVAGQDIKSGKLIQVLSDYAMPYKTLYALFAERRYLPEKIRVFIDFIIEKIGGDDPCWNCDND